MFIDFRSDTVTKPTEGMLQAMMTAEVGDDVFGEDPTIQKLEQRLAEMFGMEKGLYCPSGTMTNQIAIKLLTNPMEELICDRLAHIYNYEGGGIAFNSSVSTRLVHGKKGIMTADMVLENINPNDIHQPSTTLVALENTMNKGGGSYYTLPQIAAISKVCKENNLYLHLDGARVFNALVETGEDPKEYGKYFDTISICLSKGLGAPAASVLLMSEANYPKALRIRKVMGGGMRQGGYLAAAGIYALDHHIERLKEDHERAKTLGETLKMLHFVRSVYPIDTNIVIFEVDDAKEMVQQLKEMGIGSVTFGPTLVRFVTHLDIDDEKLEKAINILRGM
ncbi:GntG family PLP-dependent aldolase [Flammeovirgaceae bacterium SG7u.111]|nr:GntG family PLP-dependent aldolase [Flammeovirgaceae bacterium SG7u.132]WPO35216.1 GntG family PLP-dependent aldolase [Flammeovirgaceae bacterium SG7u.111]